MRKENYLLPINLYRLIPGGIIMQLRDKVYDKVSKMSTSELSLVYEQIELMEKIKKASRGKKGCKYSIEEVLEMTKSSKNSWADEVEALREERM